MPDWIWIIIVVLFLYEKWGKLRVFDVGKGLIHIEFSESRPELGESETMKAVQIRSKSKHIGN